MPLRPIYQISNDDVSSALLSDIGTASLGVVPKVTSLTYPNNTNAASNGQTIQVNGTNFTSSSTVWVDYSQVSVVSFVNANTLTFTAPSKNTNTYITQVLNTDGAIATLIPGINYDYVTWSSPANGAAYTANAGSSVSVSLAATSALGKTITYSVVGGSLPTNVTISGSSITGAANTNQANTSVTIRATAANTLVYADLTLYFTVTPVRTFTISPAVSGKTTWQLDVDGILTLPSGTYTATPAAATFTANVAMWGGGGGGKDNQFDSSSNFGGNGGSTFATITFEYGKNYVLVSAAGPVSRQGNYSGIFDTGISQANAIVMAGGGGGGGYSTAGNHGAGGNGGGNTGVDGQYMGLGSGGTQVGGGAGGTYVAFNKQTGTNGNPGTALTGGAGVGNYGAGAGGSGYWGGGSAAYSAGFDAVGGGGGGSGYVKTGVSGNTHQGIVEQSSYRGSTAGTNNNGGRLVVI